MKLDIFEWFMPIKCITCEISKEKIMKSLKQITVAVLVTQFLAMPFVAFSADTKTEKKTEKAKPYPLTKCVVSDEKFGGDMGEPYVFTHEGQEVKLCCKSCKKDFDKNSAKFMKKIADASKKK